ncbi:MAG TPA: hypothetical protein VM925_37455 [Labilithrix sp.]|nr:hypothetical protein [Labilithrix sp.]
MRRSRVLVVAVLGVLSMAPTAGDIGGCGAEVKLLDATEFAVARKEQDCERCRECGISTARCTRACDATKATETNIPPSCQPLAHDGDVCLRALGAASCEAYATYVDDVAPSTPSECEFCKVAPERPAPAFAPDGAPSGTP